MKAEDILPDRQDRIRLGGVEIRRKHLAEKRR